MCAATGSKPTQRSSNAYQSLSVASDVFMVAHKKIDAAVPVCGLCHHSGHYYSTRGAMPIDDATFHCSSIKQIFGSECL